MFARTTCHASKFCVLCGAGECQVALLPRLRVAAARLARLLKIFFSSVGISMQPTRCALLSVVFWSALLSRAAVWAAPSEWLPLPPSRQTLHPATGEDFQPPPKHRLLLSALIGGRLNPIGAELQVRFGYQLRLHERSAPLYRENLLFLGIYPRLNPAAIKVGPSIEVQPLSIFNLRLAAEYVSYFSTFGSLQSFSSPLDEYADPSLDRAEQQARNYATQGAHLVIEPTLQGKVGWLAVRNKLSIEYYYMRLRGADTVFYDATQDTLLAANGWLLTDDLDLLAFIRPTLIVGVRYSAVKPLYRSPDFRTGEEPHLEDNSHQRLGPILSYSIHTRSRHFANPTLQGMVAWYLDHRYRTGAAPTEIIPHHFIGSRGLPYVVLALSVQSDLLPLRQP